MTQTCIILAGGLGTRLRSVVADRPKCLAPVGERTFLDIQIAQLAAAGVEQVVLSLGYLADKVIAAVERGHHGIPVRCVVEPELLGTGGAIAHVQDTLQLDEVLVANGDTWLEGNVSGLLQPLDRAYGERMRMAVVAVQDRARFGGIETDASGRVVGFLEKGRTEAGLINAGLYRLCRAALPVGPPRRNYSLEGDVLPGLTRAGAVSACVVEGAFTDIGVPDDYLRFCTAHAAR